MVSGVELFLTGVLSSAVGIVGYARLKGFNLFAISDLLKALGEHEALKEEVKGAIGNISLTEIGALLTEAQVASIGGYTQEEVERIAKKLIDAAASK